MIPDEISPVPVLARAAKQPQIYRYAGLCCHQVWRQAICLVENKQHGFSSYVREKLGKDEPLNASCNVFHSSTDFLCGAMAGVTNCILAITLLKFFAFC